MNTRWCDRRQNLAFLTLFCCFVWTTASRPVAAETLPPSERISLENVVILVDKTEPSYIQYGAKDLASYLSEINGNQIKVENSPDAAKKAKSILVIGAKMSLATGDSVLSAEELGEEGAIIRSYEKSGSTIVAVAGSNPKGTNWGIATLSQLIRAEGKSAYLEGPLDLKSKPSVAVRGFHLNGWSLNYPYGFRTWKEEDWKRFVDIAWVQHVNLFYLWPFMEIMPVPLSSEDEAYLQEVRRVVEYAQNKRGMEVWIMQSANRVAVSDCGSRDPRLRTYWVGDCQKDMDPADPQQYGNILKSFEAFYKIVNNADGFCLIDSDPGGWPHSPLSDQAKIFNSARTLLNRYNVHAEKTKLIDWMWIGWGRVFDPTEKNREESAVGFMVDTIRNFKTNLPEPWELISGMSSYLKSAERESVLGKTTYLHYGAIEMEPAFPATNMGLESIQDVFEKAGKYPGLKGLMGNNEIMLLQFPRTYYFFSSLWDESYKNRNEQQVLREVSRQLYPDHADVIADSFLALKENSAEKIGTTLADLEKFIRVGDPGRPGALGRYLFPDRFAVAKILQRQLEIRSARQSLLKALEGSPSVQECATLVENYFDKLLAWNQETGWDEMINITIWRTPIYEEGKDLREGVTQLKKVLAQGKPYTSYVQTNDFFEEISKKLFKKYGRDSVMIGCIEPFKLAVIQN